MLNTEFNPRSFDVMINNNSNSFYFVKSKENDDPTTTLKSIETIVKDHFKYDFSCRDIYSTQPEYKLFELLNEKSLLLYQDIQLKATEIIRKRNEIQATVSRIGNYIHPAQGILASSDVIGELAKYLTITQLLKIARLNRKSNTQMAYYFFGKRKEYGYEGENVMEAFNFVKHTLALFKEISYLVNAGVIHRKHASYLKNQIDSEKTFRNLLGISTPDLFEILSYYQIYDEKPPSFSNFKALFNPSRNYNISESLSDIDKSRGTQALFYAARKGEKNIVALLLQHRADPEFMIKKNGCALDIAAQAGFDEIVELLLKAGAKPNTKKDGIHTSLMFACGYGNKEYHKPNIKVVELLLKYGADFILKTKSGQTPLELARTNKLQEIICLLEEYGAK